MRIESFAGLQDGETFDFIVVGSGFGGSVAALRLSEKGYSVAVLEAGRHFEDSEFPKSNWDLPRYLWAPKLGCRGIQRLDKLEHLLVLSGAGLGGGSLVYANTLLEPAPAFFKALGGLDLRPHLATAKRMLGAARAPRLFPADEAVRQAAARLGRAGTFHEPEVGVFFGEPGAAARDPYFDGAGPERRGCIFCGGCMVGCRHNAKNTLVKNYLHLAARRGARFFTGSQARRLEDIAGGGVAVTVERPGWGVGEKIVRAKGLILAAGVLGTLSLLLEPSNRLGEPPPRLGRDVRTNGEQLLGAFAKKAETDWSQGVAIGSGVWADDETHLEPVRYPRGSGAMGLLAWPVAGSIGRRLRSLWPFGWAERATILLAMQTLDSRLRLRLCRGRLATALEDGAAPPAARLPAAERFRDAFCAQTGALPMTTLVERWLGIPATAHILGGVCRGASPETGCVGPDGRLFGRKDVWVLDGSAMPANPGSNPSLTITALAEQAMSLVPPRS